MSKVDEIKNQLAQRLEKQSTRPYQKRAQDPEIKSDGTHKEIGVLTHPVSKGSETAKTQVYTAEGVIKISASLYAHDIECLDRIRDFMRKSGVRNITDSEALRLACRAVKIDDGFLDIYRNMSKEDRRRRKE